MPNARWRSHRLSQLGSAIFAEVAGWKEEARQAGLDVIDLGIGSPDLPPAAHIREALGKAVLQGDNYGYPASQGSKAFRQEASKWLQARFGAELDADKEIIALMGSQDGLAHLALALCDEGDYAILPDPGYPIYAAGLALAGVKPYYMPLAAERQFRPDLQGIPEEVWRKAKFVLISHPGNPIATLADQRYFAEVLDYAREYEVLVVHDMAYSEMAFDGVRPISILQLEGAKELTVEFHSLSKSFNMAGCRIGYMAGNREAVAALRELKANIDYGVFEAVQHAAIAALQADIAAGCPGAAGAIYESRRDSFVAALAAEGWQVDKPPATMFVWAKLPVQTAGGRCPAGYARQISREMLLEAGVAVIPGDAFGKQGEGYVRIALVVEESRLNEAARRIGRFMRERGLLD